MVLLLALCALPFVLAVTLLATRRPLHWLLPAYALVVPFGSGLAVPGLPASYFSASSLTAAALTASLTLRLALKHEGPRVIPPTVVVWLLFAAVAGTTSYWSVAPGQSLSSFITLLAVVALYVTMRLTDASTDVVRRTEAALVIGGVVVAVYGLWQFATDSLTVSDAGSARFGRDLTDPNHIAASLLLPFAVTLQRLITARQVLWRVSLSFAAAVVVITVLLTASRGGVLGLAVVVLVTAATGANRGRTLTYAFVPIVLVTLAALAVPGLVSERLTSEGTSGRTDVWRVGLSSCPQHCLVGSGWGTFAEVYFATLPGTPEATPRRETNMNPHNNFLGVLVETGATGLSLLVAGLALTVRELRGVPRHARGTPAAALAGIFVTGMLIGNFEFKYFWLVLMYVGLVSTCFAGDRLPLRTTVTARSPARAGP